VLDLPPVIGVPAVRTYSPRYLSEDERIRLADERREGRSIREIAALLGRSPSTISRELRRGADQAGRYRPHEAHRRALQRRRLQRPGRLAADADLREWVTAKLLKRWSPEQISRDLRRKFPDRPSWWLCAETIYQAVYRPDLGGLPRELPGRVPRPRRRPRRPHRDARARSRHRSWQPIHDSGAPARRQHDSATVRDAVVAALAVLPAHMRRTLTWDQGKEMARHVEIAAALSTTKVYFCDPHSPWQRPRNEHTNGMLRDYFPKGTDLSIHSAVTTWDSLAAGGARATRART
jgi:IS30 family transposase